MMMVGKTQLLKEIQIVKTFDDGDDDEVDYNGDAVSPDDDHVNDNYLE